MDAPTSLADQDLVETLALVRAEQEPPTAADVAAALAIPRSVARWRLERLVGAGLLEPVFARRNGRTGPGAGRPAKAYAVAPASADVQLYPELVRLFVAALPARGRRGRLTEVGSRFGRELARAARLQPAARAQTAADRICRALGRLGFQTSAEVSETRLTFVTPTCPLRPFVLEDAAVRDVDRGMWRALVGAALGSRVAAEIRCETHDCLATAGPCRVVVDVPVR